MSFKHKTVYFKEGGKENTVETLKLARDAALKREIDVVLVSSTTGYTAEMATTILRESVLKMVIVTHQTGYREPGVQLFPQELRERIEAEGAQVVTCTDVLTGGASAGIGRQRGEVSEPQRGRLPWIVPPPNVTVAHTLRLFSQGVKVCAEIAMMACDSNAIPSGEPIVAVAGSHAGADTAMVITPTSSNRIRDMKLHEIICKPY
ncbi:MAG: hypothetical protein ACLFVP_04575 [Candidatus Bathyarchaeia archaeon]